ALMVCEMFALGERDLRLPGLGSYLQSASNAGSTKAILWGLFTMIAVIVLIDQIVWRPLIAWSEKFKFEQVEASQTPRSLVLDFLRRSKLLSRARETFFKPALEAVTLRFARAHPTDQRRGSGRNLIWIARVVLAVMTAAILYAIVK